MKIKDGRIKIECEKGRSRFSERKYAEFLAEGKTAKQKAVKKSINIQEHVAHSKAT